MADLIIIGFADEGTAGIAAEEAQRTAGHLIAPNAIAAVIRDAQGRVRVQTNRYSDRSQAGWGVFSGALFSNPSYVTGTTIGLLGSALGQITAASPYSDFQDRVRELLQPGTSALVMMGTDTPGSVIDALSQYEGTVLRTSLPEPSERALEQIADEPIRITPGSYVTEFNSRTVISRDLDDAAKEPLPPQLHDVDEPREELRDVPGVTGSGVTPPGSPVPAERPPIRHLTVNLPERAPVGRRISLLVRITLTEPSLGASSALNPFDVPPEGGSVTINVSAPGLIPMGDLEQDLHVPKDRDSDPIRFGFKTGRAGLHSIIVSAFADGTFVGELALQISVEVGAALEEGPGRTATLAVLAAEPGEVTLQVSRTDEDRYSFQLMGEALYPVELTRRLAGDPTDVVNVIVDELRAMAARTSPFTTSALVRNRIKNLGAQLWAEAVPEAIRQQFWAQADHIKLFTVASDRDTIPWELLYPVDGDNDNGFLVEQFPVVRRVYGQGRIRQLPLASAAYVVPPESPGNAMDEVQAVRARLGADVEDRGVVDRLDALIALLDSAPSVLHFACHNQFTDQAGSVLGMVGGPLRPSDLAIAAQKRGLAAASPLVFFNACRTAGEIPGLMQMMGWAKQFMGAGAGAFLGSLWAVRSSSAQAFADAFYHALVTERVTLGAASLQARKAIAEDGGDPTWLAYTIYGNPSATIGDGDQA